MTPCFFYIFIFCFKIFLKRKGDIMKIKKSLFISVVFLLAFVLWTVLICFVDVGEIGPRESSVGFATLNEFIHNLTGVNMTLYVVTDWLGLVPVFLCIGFAVFGLIQWIKRRSILKVDYSILTLGGFYIIVMAAYILFEMYVINYRPVLINGYLEASYPSSTTMLVMCVMPTALMQFDTRIKNRLLRNSIKAVIIAFTVFMVVARLISGVHWVTDIIGGALLSTGFVTVYYSVSNFIDKR